MVSPYHATGFYHATVTKGLMGSLVMSSAAMVFPFSNYRSSFLCTDEDIFEKHKVGNFLLSKLVYLDPKDLLCAGLLLYHFRIFERRYGSRKFSGYLLSVFSFSLILELLLLFLCRQLQFTLSPMPTGPFAMVFALFVPYFSDVPRVAITNFMGIPVTGKSLTYIVALQMASSSMEGAVLMLCGVTSGFIHKWLKLECYTTVPRRAGGLIHRIIGRLIDTQPPVSLNKPVGATLEVQRQEQIERLEHMHLNQLPNQRFPGFAGLFRNFQNHDQQHEPVGAPPPPSDDQIKQLEDMGFQRENVVRALRATDNNIQMATNILLHDG